MIRYHGHLKDLPEEFSDLPVIGFVRNPWDWYVSMFCDYRRKQQYIFQVCSNRGALGFKETVARFLNLGDGSIQSKRMLARLATLAPRAINARTNPRRGVPGLRSEHFKNYPENVGYYTFLFQLMYESDRTHQIHIGRFENLREEALRLFELSGTPITRRITNYLNEARPLNRSDRPETYIGGYPPDLEKLVAKRDSYLIDRFDYEFSVAKIYPKTDFFRQLGAVDVSGLVSRLENIPESLWVSENENKPNKFARLNDTRHIIFRFLDGLDNAFNFNDHPVLWNEWKNDLLPIMDQAARSLGYSDYRFPRVMFARLPAGGQISSHSDGEASHYIHKIHVPLVTNSETIFHVGDKSMQMPVGEIIEVNNKRLHSVSNDGDQDRIHLIFECYNMDDYGKAG